MRIAVIALVAIGCTPTPTSYAAATNHVQSSERSYFISVEGAHIDGALATFYVSRRAGELCLTGYDVLTIDRVCGSVYSDVGRSHVRILCSHPTHIATVQCRWHGL